MARFSPRSIVLCIVLLFSTNALAVSAVLGVDLGTEYIKAALVKPRIPLEIVLTKDSRRKETSAVVFKPNPNAPKAGSYPERAYGSDAVALAARFPGEVYPNLKTLLGLPVEHSIVKEYHARHPALQLEAHKTRGTVAFKSKTFTSEEETWMVEELLAMELQSIQRNAEALAGSDTSVRSIVITVPPFYNIEERRAIKMAAELVGLKVLSLMSDGMAVGLNYATSRTFPIINDGGKPEHHVVFDMGAGSASATVLKFQGRVIKDVGKYNKTVQEVQVLGSGWDRTLGGDSLNYLIVDDMISSFVDSAAAKKASVVAEDVQKHGRAVAKLLKEAERLRHILSANIDTQGSFEGLYEDVDFKYKISRATFEKFAEPHSERVAAVLQKALAVADLDISQIDSIILHGGATRTPFVQKALSGIAGSDKLRSNVNSDESAVFGAGFRAAEISPSFIVKDIRIADGASYPAGMKWVDPKKKSQQQRLWTEKSHLGASPKELTFSNQEDFAVTFYQQVPGEDGTVERDTRVLVTKNLTTTVTKLAADRGCAASEIHFKVKLRLNAEDGEVEVLKAHVECEAEVSDKDGSIVDGVKNLFGFGKKDQQPLKDGEEDVKSTSSSSASSSSSSTKSRAASGSSSSAAAAEGSPKPKKKQIYIIPVDFTIENAGTAELSKEEMIASKDRLKAFEASDRARRQREEALNQLEAFTYKIRDLLESESFVGASSPDTRSLLEQKAAAASEWLYDDGASAPREELKSRLKELKDLVNPVERRLKENKDRPELVKSLRSALDQTSVFIESIKEKIAEAEALVSSAGGSATSDAVPTVTAAPSSSSSSDGFDDLEDDDFTRSTTTTATSAETPIIPQPMYQLDDLKKITDLSQATLEWLEGKIADQARLPLTADPVLTAKDIQDKTKELEQAGMEIAMKAVRQMDKQKKESTTKAKKAKATKKSGAAKSGAADAEPTLKFEGDQEFVKKYSGGENGLSEEELEALVEKLKKEYADTGNMEDHDEL